MGAIRAGSRVIVTEGWAKGRHGRVSRIVDGYATVTLDGGLYTMTHVGDLRREGDDGLRPEAPGESGSGDELHRVPPAA